MIRFVLSGSIIFASLLSFSYAAVLTAQDVFVADFSADLEAKVSFAHQKDIISHFCTTLYTQDILLINNSQDIYNPKQSFFVHVLCKPFSSASDLDTSDNDDYFKKDTRDSFGVVGRKIGTINACDSRYGMQYCNIVTQFSRVYNDIIGDYIDIQQAQIYGATQSSDTPTKKAEDYVAKYFAWFIICPNQKCTYPDTQKRLVGYIKNAQSLLDDLDIIDYKKLMNQKTDTCSFAPKKTSYRHVVCGLHAADVVQYTNFLQLAYNEQFFYHLFLRYLAHVANTDITFLPADIRSDVEKTAMARISLQQSIDNNIQRSTDALETSLRMLQEMRVTFPLHITLLFYYEDLKKLRQELVKIVTPLYTLYDKLRNVQKKD